MHQSGKLHLTTFQIIILGFAAVILLGAGLLMLPFASREPGCASFSDAIFTATSAVCVTGLVVRDTASYWTWFGQGVILFLIQIGGLGVVTFAASFALLSGRKLSLMQRSTMQEAISAPKIGGIAKLTGFILRATLVMELAGAVLLLPAFCRSHGLRGVWMAVFHAVSAFCNAGFDLMGTADAPFRSLTGLAFSPLVNLTVAALIIFGGIGFLTWEDLWVHGYRCHRYRMQTKVILLTSLLLIVFPMAYFYFGEFREGSVGNRLLLSLFQAVTPRTAGFNTADLGAMSGGGQAITIALMLVGGSPGSTAGGMKTTTFAVLFLNLLATFRRREDVEIFGRRIEGPAVRNACAIFVMYITLFFAGALSISLLEGLSMKVCFFEAASAVGTVGLTLGITPTLGTLSRVVLILLMFLGRVGGLTLIFAALTSMKKKPSRLPPERITVG